MHQNGNPRSFHQGFGLVLSLIASGPAYAQTPSLQDVADLVAPKPAITTIYTAKEFITMDSRLSRAEAVAVKEGRFIAVGKLADVQAAAGKDAKLNRTFADKVVIAGFVEQHVHPALAALTMNTKVISIEDWDAIDGFSPAVRDPKEYEKRLKKALREHSDKSKPFITWGYHHYMHGEMNQATLNKLAPDFPVIVWHRSCHELFFNATALKLIGIDKNLIMQFPKSAQAQINFEKGHFFEQGMIAVLGKVAPFMASPTAFKRGLEYSVKFYHKSGITVCCEPGGFVSKPVQDLINSVYSKDEVPFNHYFMVDGKTFAFRHPRDPKALVADSEQVLSWGKGRTAYLPKQVKLFSDGAIYSQLMQMKDGYTDGHTGAWILDPPVLGYAFQAYWDAGYQIHIHNNGDAGFEVVIGELAKAMKRAPRKDHRTVLVHFGFAQADQVKKWIELGGIVSSNPYYVTALAVPYAKIGLGPDRARNIAPHKFVIDNNGSLSFHSDMPMAPAKPLQLAWAGVNRQTYEGQVAGPEHKVPLDAALKAITIDAAYSIRLEKEIGSIEVGKRANLTVLEKDPYRVEPKYLKDIPIWGTMLEGRVQPVKTTSEMNPVQQSKKPGQAPATTTPESSVVPRNWDTRTQPVVCAPGCTCSIGKLFGHYIEVQMEAHR